jgi:hypothetical protein
MALRDTKHLPSLQLHSRKYILVRPPISSRQSRYHDQATDRHDPKVVFSFLIHAPQNTNTRKRGISYRRRAININSRRRKSKFSAACGTPFSTTPFSTSPRSRSRSRSRWYRNSKPSNPSVSIDLRLGPATVKGGLHHSRQAPQRPRQRDRPHLLQRLSSE